MAVRRNDFLAVIAGMSIAAAARRRRIVTARTAWKSRCRPTFFRTAAN
jgi:hypothetical protein